MAVCWTSDVVLFVAGALLCNALPHVCAGARGEPFPTPFATPRGIGPSSPVTNFLSGSANLALGIALVVCWLTTIDVVSGMAPAALGWLASGLYFARQFGKVRSAQGERPTSKRWNNRSLRLQGW